MNMTDPDINSGYYQPSLGSLSGFQQATTVSGGAANLAEVGWSISQLRAFLLNESGENFPTEDQVRTINSAIIDHVTNFNNPHQVTLDQLGSNFVLQVLAAVTPGTPPNSPPFYSFDATYALPLGDVFPSTFGSTNLYRMTSGGVLTDPSTESEIFGTDYLVGKPGIPLFGTIANIVPSGWATQSGILVNTLMTTTTAQPGLPFTFYQLTETNATGSFGIKIPMTEALSTVYTTTVFLFPTVTGGSAVISQPSLPANNMTVNLTDGTYTFSSPTVTGETFVYPSGIIRVSFSFTSLNPTPDNYVQILHLNTGDTVTARSGQIARPLFVLAHPIASTSFLNQPVIIDRTQPGSTQTFALKLDKIPAPTSMANLTLTLALNLYPTLAGASLGTATRILTFDTLTIERDATNIYVKSSGTTLFTSAILNGLNILSLSYSPTAIDFKDLAAARQTHTGVYPPLATAAASAGPCGGYLYYIAMYASADKGHALEYFSNG